MGMAAPDVVLFVVGFLLFGGAVTAIVVQGGPSALAGGGAATTVYAIDFATKSVDVGKDAVADFNGQHKASINVTTHNVSVMHVTVQCSDPASALPAGGFNIQLQIQPPAGIAAPPAKVGVCGQTISVDIPVASVPPKTSGAGSSPDDAAANLPMAENHTAALGTWVITTNGARGGLPVGAPSNPSNPGGSLVLKADVWEAKATAVPK